MYVHFYSDALWELIFGGDPINFKKLKDETGKWVLKTQTLCNISLENNCFLCSNNDLLKGSVDVCKLVWRFGIIVLLLFDSEQIICFQFNKDSLSCSQAVTLCNKLQTLHNDFSIYWCYLYFIRQFVRQPLHEPCNSLHARVSWQRPVF